MTAVLVVLAAIFGSLIGSFLNVVIHRLPRDEPLGLLKRTRSKWGPRVWIVAALLATALGLVGVVVVGRVVDRYRRRDTGLRQGMLLWRRGQYAMAIPLLEKEAQDRPVTHEVHRTLADALANRRQLGRR